ncbi:MAG: class I SAM-dependent methyltransferase [Candidatus Pacebacteria bacterium]|nr:class I SAM-dependent methyltransferase [Candidatus Paceibacterota bacterium]
MKRYPKITLDYIHFFFKKRLKIVLKELENNFKDRNNLNLLEIGCADGIVLRRILERMENHFSDIVGIDLSEGMIKEAKNLTIDKKINYFVRGAEKIDKKFDVIVEVGVVNYADVDKELSYVKNNLNRDGVYILSLAGKGSLNDYFGKGDGYNNFLSYHEYEDKIRKNFKISKIIPVGFYLPLIWRVPVLARVWQFFIEIVLGPFLPNLFHEKVYILKLK